MSRMKTFFIYFLLVVLFFIFSRIVIAVSIDTTYSYKSYEIITTIPMTAEVQATSLTGVVKGKVINNTDNIIENKWIKIDCYSKNGVLLGTKYIEIDKVNTKEDFTYEIRFNYNRVEKVVVDIVDKLPDKINDEDLFSDPEMNIGMLAAALLVLYIL